MFYIQLSKLSFFNVLIDCINEHTHYALNQKV